MQNEYLHLNTLPKAKEIIAAKDNPIALHVLISPTLALTYALKKPRLFWASLQDPTMGQRLFDAAIASGAKVTVPMLLEYLENPAQFDPDRRTLSPGLGNVVLPFVRDPTSVQRAVIALAQIVTQIDDNALPVVQRVAPLLPPKRLMNLLERLANFGAFTNFFPIANTWLYLLDKVNGDPDDWRQLYFYSAALNMPKAMDKCWAHEEARLDIVDHIMPDVVERFALYKQAGVLEDLLRHRPTMAYYAAEFVAQRTDRGSPDQLALLRILYIQYGAAVTLPAELDDALEQDAAMHAYMERRRKFMDIVRRCSTGKADEQLALVPQIRSMLKTWPVDQMLPHYFYYQAIVSAIRNHDDDMVAALLVGWPQYRRLPLANTLREAIAFVTEEQQRGDTNWLPMLEMLLTAEAAGGGPLEMLDPVVRKMVADKRKASDFMLTATANSTDDVARTAAVNEL